jgi:hypothetical protein
LFCSFAGSGQSEGDRVPEVRQVLRDGPRDKEQKVPNQGDQMSCEKWPNPFFVKISTELFKCIEKVPSFKISGYLGNFPKAVKSRGAAVVQR